MTGRGCLCQDEFKRADAIDHMPARENPAAPQADDPTACQGVIRAVGPTPRLAARAPGRREPPATRGCACHSRLGRGAPRLIVLLCLRLAGRCAVVLTVSGAGDLAQSCASADVWQSGPRVFCRGHACKRIWPGQGWRPSAARGAGFLAIRLVVKVAEACAGGFCLRGAAARLQTFYLCVLYFMCMHMQRSVASLGPWRRISGLIPSIYDV